MNYNKLKRAAENITMPEGMEERIIEKCRDMEKSADKKIKGEYGYSQQVSGVETAKKIRISRIISAAAACAVLAGGINAAVHLSGKTPENTVISAHEAQTQEKTPDSTENMSVQNSEAATQKASVYDGVIPTQETSAPTADKPNPLSDFSEQDYKYVGPCYGIISVRDPNTIKYLRDNQKSLNEDQKSQIAEFFSSCEYGEWTHEDEMNALINSYYDDRVFVKITETSIETITIDCNDRLTISRAELNSENTTAIQTIKYKIDYEAFLNVKNAVLGTEDNHIQLNNFESCINDGATVKYTLSDTPMPDLTIQQCRLLDEYFSLVLKNNTLKLLEGYDTFTMPVIKFEMTKNDNSLYSLFIYSDDYILLSDGTSEYKLWYKYCGKRMHAEIETILRHGSTIDSANLYPPFGNLAKCVDTVDITYYNGSFDSNLNMNGESVHQAFYGYNWNLYESVQPNDTASDQIKFKFRINGSDEIHVAAYADGYICWKRQDYQTDYIYEEHWYKFPDSDIYETLLIPFNEKIGNVE